MSFIKLIKEKFKWNKIHEISKELKFEGIFDSILVDILI